MSDVWLYVAMAIGLAKLAALLGMQLVGDAREAARQAGVKRILAQPRAYKPTVSVLVHAEALSLPISHCLDAIYASSYNIAAVEVYVPVHSALYRATLAYRRKHHPKTPLVIRTYAPGTPWLTSQRLQTKSKIVLLIDGDAALQPETVSYAVVPFRDKTVAAAIPTFAPHVTTALASGIRAWRHVVSMHFRRGCNPQPAAMHGALFVRTVTLRRIIRASHGIIGTQDIFAAVRIKGAQQRGIRHAEAVMVTDDVRFAPIFSVRALLWWAIDIIAIWAVIAYFGWYQGLVILGCAALYLLLLVSIAIAETPGVSRLNKWNLLLLSPFSYISTQLLAPLFWCISPLLRVLRKNPTLHSSIDKK